MRIKNLPLFVHDGKSSRANITCRYKCGDACSHAVPNNSGGAYFGDIVRGAVSRRGVLRGGAMAVLAVGAGGVLTACSDDAGAGETPAPGSSDLGPAAPGTDFTPVAPNTADAVTVPHGYEQAVVIRHHGMKYVYSPNRTALRQKMKMENEELYDLTADPAERHNLVLSGHPRLAQFRRKARRWMGGPKPPAAAEAHFDERTTARLRALGYLAPAPVTVPASVAPPGAAPPARAQ